MRKLTKLEFIERSSIIHNNFYDYSLVIEFINKSQKVDIICKEHGAFSQEIGNHLYHKRGCRKCALSVRKKVDDPISKFREVHGEYYDYSKVEYISIKRKVLIICKEHGEFYQTPHSHIRGSGCYYCGLEKMKRSLKKPIYEFIRECNIIHSNLYDYSKVKYDKLTDKIIIICSDHGEFEQRAFSHKQGYGCSKCNKSKGEYKIEFFLLDKKINYKYNKRFDDCKNINTLPFDFYLPEFNICIEYDGIQHYEIVEHFGGQYKLDYQNKLDSIKNNWCLDNNVKLLRISYKDYNNIENILNNFLYKNKI